MAVIVLGIAVALGADAWWENRQERAYEQMALRQLSTEFADNAAQLDSVIGHHRSLEKALVALVELEADDASVTTDSLRVLLTHLDNWWTFNPQSGALGALLSSGGLRSIRSDALRVELAGWPGRLDDYQEDELQLVEFAMTQQEDFMISTGLGLYLYFPGVSGESATGVLGTSAFRNILAGRYGYLPNLLQEAAGLQSDLKRLRALLREELAG